MYNNIYQKFAYDYFEVVIFCPNVFINQSNAIDYATMKKNLKKWKKEIIIIFTYGGGRKFVFDCVWRFHIIAKIIICVPTYYCIVIDFPEINNCSFTRNLVAINKIRWKIFRCVLNVVWRASMRVIFWFFLVVSSITAKNRDYSRNNDSQLFSFCFFVVNSIENNRRDFYILIDYLFILFYSICGN